MSGKALTRDFAADDRLKQCVQATAAVLFAVCFHFYPASVDAAIDWSGNVSPANPATWTTSTTGYIGQSSTATVTVDGGSGLLSYKGYLGYNAGINGTATISGTGTTWTNNNFLYLGHSGNGTLTIKAGGHVSDYYSFLGYNAGSSGTVTVTGAGSLWTNTQEPYIGYTGNGTLNVEAGGQVHANSAAIGWNAGSLGQATITGSGSKMILNYGLSVGTWGNGTLKIEAGGYVSSVSGNIGTKQGSTGTATVLGTGSTWTVGGELQLGADGSTGKLTVSNGGTVTCGTLYGSLGDLIGNGTITARGAVLDADLVFDAAHGTQQAIAFGSGGTLNLNLNGSGVFGAGFQGIGSVRVADGILISSTGGTVGHNANATGTAIVTGTGSKWINSGNLPVGDWGNGTLVVEAGGLVSDVIGILGSNPGTVGTATVSGTGSKWISSSRLCVGGGGKAGGGSGTLNIGGDAAGGTVQTQDLVVAADNSSTGVCNLGNGGTLLAGTLRKGTGTATFNWNDGTIQNYDANTNLTISNSNNLVLKLAATGTHAFNIDLNRTGTVDAILSDATTNGTLTKTGAGVLTLTGLNTYSGETVVEAGRFKVTGSILNTSGISVGESGILELAKSSGNTTAASMPISNSGTILISAGSQSVGVITGTGITQVNAGATLTANSIIQNTLSIGGTGAGFVDAADSSTLSQVPEPGAFALLSMSAFGLLAWVWRRAKLNRILVCFIALSISTAGTSQAVTIDLVPVGNINNAADTVVMWDGTNGYGSVSYTYSIGKCEITAGQYTAFLNAVAGTSDPYGLYNSRMQTTTYGSPIIYDSYTHTYTATSSSQPVNNVSWGSAVRFCNWMSNGQPTTGEENFSTTEDGSYYLDGATSDEQLMAVTRKANATWVIPTENEWYKAAYYDPNKLGGSGYWLYPTKSDTAPSNTLPPTGTNNANFSGYPLQMNTTAVGSFANSLSAYDTLDQGGNVWEWNETALGSRLRGLRGGSFRDSAYSLASTTRVSDFNPSYDDSSIGFRVASVPEPCSLLMTAMIAVGGLVYRWRRNRKAV